MNYPPNMTLRPILAWPRAETRHRARSNFSAPWSATLEMLDRELYYLGPGRDHAKAVLQIAMREQDFRLDGMPRANAVPEHPGVILNVESTKGPLSFPSDKFDRWQDNLRAIALGLEALRKIDRYGITPGNEQYTGWKALPQRVDHQTWTADEAERFLRGLVFGPDTDGLNLGTLAQTYRRAKAAAHPDRNGGDRSQWDKVEHAGQVLTAAGAL